MSDMTIYELLREIISRKHEIRERAEMIAIENGELDESNNARLGKMLIEFDSENPNDSYVQLDYSYYCDDCYEHDSCCLIPMELMASDDWEALYEQRKQELRAAIAEERRKKEEAERETRYRNYLKLKEEFEPEAK